jgi:transcription elongation factor GreA
VGENLVYLTNEGIKNLTKEMKDIQQVLHNTNQETILDEQERQFLEQRVELINGALANSEILVSNDEIVDEAKLGSIVRLCDLRSNEVLEYMIVNEIEANPIEKKLSVSSPLGKALTSRKIGETVKIKIDNEDLLFEIVDIS